MITRGIVPSAKKVVIYGPEGIGKTTLASKFPDPVFIDTEGSTKAMDVARLPSPANWDEMLEDVRYVYSNPDCCKTLVIDTMDWAETIAIKSMLKKDDKKSIEDYGYGKGYVRIQEEIQSFLNELDKVIGVGIHVVLTAHAKMRKFEQPDEIGAYDRWEMKMSKNVSPIVKEWADMVLFCNYKINVIKTETNARKAQGGKRIMYTTHNPCWDAKNRCGLPDEMDMDYEGLKAVIGDVPKPLTLSEMCERDGVSEQGILILAMNKGWIQPDEFTSVNGFSDKLKAFLIKEWDKVKVLANKEEVPFEEE